jgi:hypothetical protein
MLSVITRTALRAGGFNALGVLNLLLHYHIALSLLNHYKRWLLAGFVGLEPTLGYLLTSFTGVTRSAVAAHKMKNSIFFLETSAFWNNGSTNLTNFEIFGKIRATVFAFHIRIKDRAHSVFECL